MNGVVNCLKRVHTDDQGFTLIELLITIVILGVIITAIGTAIFVGLRTTNATSRRLAQAHDAELITSYFGPDVQSSDSVTATALDARCTTGVTGTPVVSFGWTEGGVVKVASYVTQTNTGSECPTGSSCVLMLRYFCNGNLTTSNVVAHLLSATSGPTISCATAGVAGGCPAGTTGTPDAVVISVTPVDTTFSAPYTVAGVRRDAL
jgi:prepilin-type N-terminal cleavage/methylation domain-containing protein